MPKKVVLMVPGSGEGGIVYHIKGRRLQGEGEGGRMLAGDGGRMVAGDAGGKRAPSAYNLFAKENIKSMPGATPRERMKQVAEQWKSHSASGEGKKKLIHRKK